MIPKDYRPAQDEEEKGGMKRKKKRGASLAPRPRLRKAMKSMVGRKVRSGGSFRPIGGGIGGQLRPGIGGSP
jgi:hypothetical protein